MSRPERPRRGSGGTEQGEETDLEVSGDEADLEEWDPMPDELQEVPAEPTPELEDPMKGPAPTG